MRTGGAAELGCRHHKIEVFITRPPYLLLQGGSANASGEMGLCVFPLNPPVGPSAPNPPVGPSGTRCCRAGVAEPEPPPARPARRARPRAAALPRPQVLKNALIPTASRDSAVFFFGTLSLLLSVSTPARRTGLAACGEPYFTFLFSVTCIYRASFSLIRKRWVKNANSESSCAQLCFRKPVSEYPALPAHPDCMLSF